MRTEVSALIAVSDLNICCIATRNVGPFITFSFRFKPAKKALIFVSWMCEACSKGIKSVFVSIFGSVVAFFSISSSCLCTHRNASCLCSDVCKDVLSVLARLSARSERGCDSRGKCCIRERGLLFLVTP